MKEINIKKITKEIIDDLYLLKSSFLSQLPNQLPRVLQLSVTGRCNSRCLMCGVWKNQTEEELNVKNISKILNNELFKNINSVGISGGEPTLRNDLVLITESLITNLKKLKSITLLTNCVQPNLVIKRIKEVDLVCKENGINFFVNLSLDGIGKKHDSNRGVNNNFKSFEIVKDFLYSNKIIFGIGMTITPNNCFFTDDVLEYCKANNIRNYKFRLGVDINRIFNIGYSEKNIFSNYQLFHLINFFYKLSITEKKYNIFYKSIFAQLAYGRKRFIGCDWKKRGVTVGPNGEISYCSVKSPIIGNATKESAINLYKNNIPIRNKIVKKFCDNCMHDLEGAPSLKNSFYLIFEKLARRYKISKEFFNGDGLISKTKNNKKHFNSKKNVSEWKNILITGWWGTETAGDKAILGELLSFLKKFNSKSNLFITSLNDFVVAQTLRELDVLNCKIIPLFNAPKNIVKLMDSIIIAGGPLMEIPEIVHIRDLFLRSNSQKCDRVIFGCGINPNLSDGYRDVISDIVKLATRGFFRDEESLKLALSYGAVGNLDFACDPSIAYVDKLKNEFVKNTKEISITTLLRENTSEYVKCINKNELSDNNKKIAKVIANALNKFCKKRKLKLNLGYTHGLFIGGDDRLYNRSVAKYLKCEYNLIREYLPLKELLKNIYNSNLVLSMRYHGHLFPFALEIPFVSIDYSGENGKVQNFLKSINYDQRITWSSINREVLSKQMERVDQQHIKINEKFIHQKKLLLNKLNKVYSEIFYLLDR